MDSSLAMALVIGIGFAGLMASSTLQVFWPDGALARWLDALEARVGRGRAGSDGSTGGDGWPDGDGDGGD